MALVGEAEHQRRLTVKFRHGHRSGKQDARSGTRKATENQAGGNGDADHAGENLDRRDHVTVKTLRVHVAVANRGQGFDAEEKSVCKRAGAGVGNGVLVHQVKQGKKVFKLRWASARQPRNAGHEAVRLRW